MRYRKKLAGCDIFVRMKLLTGFEQGPSSEAGAICSMGHVSADLVGSD